MGVHGLWKILEPAHRPVKLETLARKRLAVDASIWIYQFLKAVRDQEGNALNNSHIVGFFRRICKLLFHGVKPVFVFDGGAPILKRQTIAGRKQRREGRREDAARTAARLLALQVKKRAEEEVKRQRASSSRQEVEHDELPEDVVYVDQLEQTPEQRKKAQAKYRKSRMTDQYQLPELEYDFTQLGAKNDVRLLTEEELKEYAKQFSEGGGGEASFDDLANIDFDSPFFKSLPDADRYRILNNARLRSRLRMGYSKEQLDKMFPDRMAFSRFQIDRVAKRNDLSQRVMHLMNNEQDTVSVSRVAGEKGKEYILVRNEGPGGGWVMSFVGQQEGDTESMPIDVENIGKEDEEQEDSEEDEAFEDVPIEGLNRLPKARNTAPGLEKLLGSEARDLRKALYESKRDQGATKRYRVQDDENEALFHENEALDLLDKEEELDTSVEDARIDADLQKAIAMSLGGKGFQAVDMNDKDLQAALQMSMGQPQTQGKDKGRATAAEVASWQEAANRLGAPDKDVFQRATPGSKTGSISGFQSNEQAPGSAAASRHPPRPPNSLPAPLKLGSGSSFLMGKSMLGMTQRPKPAVPKPASKDTEKPIPLPPWFAKDGKSTISEQQPESVTKTDSYETREAPKKDSGPQIILDVDSDDDVPMEDVPIRVQGNDVLSSDAADRIRAQPPKSSLGVHNPPPAVIPDPRPDQPNAAAHDSEEEFEWEESDHEQGPITTTKSPSQNEPEKERKEVQPDLSKPSPPPPPPDDAEFEDFDFSFEADEPTNQEEVNLEDADEIELLEQMAVESEEHARFAASLTHGQPTHNDQSADQTTDKTTQPTPVNLRAYDEELRNLRKQQKANLRDADEVTQTMIHECQSLLTLFGLPYITAPMEAEAQCAELVRLNLVDGIVTDDSDVFLFGGTRVYRYMFNDRQTVQCYLSSDLEKEFSLDRRRLISAAHLLGSDYTEGIPSVGPVTAIELLAEFPGEHGLEDFKNWWERVQKGIDDPAKESSTPFRKKFRKQVGKVFLPPNFPDHRIDEAYLHPEVDSDPSPFEWGVPDLDGLRDFLMSSLGWGRERTDQVLVPVVRDMNQKLAEGSQVNITNYFQGGVGVGGFAPRVKPQGGSKRMEKAMRSLHERAKQAAGGADDGTRNEADGEVEEVEGTTKQIKPMSMRERAAIRAAEREKENGSDEEGIDEDEEDELEEIKKKGKKRKAPAKRGRARKRGTKT